MEKVNRKEEKYRRKGKEQMGKNGRKATNGTGKKGMNGRKGRKGMERNG